MDISYPAEAESFRAEVRAVLATELPPGWPGIGAIAGRQDAERFAAQWRQTLYRRGLLGITASLGPVQILVNNAAVNVVGSIFGYDPADWDRVIRVNLTGPWYLCRRTMPLMREAGGGVIVNVGSYAPDVGGGGIEAPYAASKGGLSALTRGLAHEGGPHRIRAVYLSMGVVKDTKFAADNAELLARMPGLFEPLGDLPGPADIAEAVAFLASDRAAYITGEVLNVAAGAYMRN